ncbi:SDR family NAD(P)-dependent oxidoreductase [Ktedonospora formicarum]|uniref:Short-chain dehydrogenase n=1 Tax=Ktedonospora formicarum TaxID=2778364 RepID=A0A8J3MRB8_9CHLR|nr:SDR family oxidoreductase [Ktedonospora formicarum]GHO45822.1 short-chain dehydrogenase [Ktedonospora formicarum]
MTERRIIIITGGGSGIGRACAREFAQKDEQVVILGRSAEKLQRCAQEEGYDIAWKQADVSQREQVERVINEIVREYGRIDVLVNAAGFVLGATTDMPLAEAEANWDAVQETNLKGSFLMTVAAAPHMPRPGGRIIYISSIAAFTGGSRAGSTAYAAAKAGVLGLTYGFARELSERGITVNAIAPGFIANTEFTCNWTDEKIQGIIAQTPVGRGGSAKDIAASVSYLASPSSSFVTGEVLNVNGGWLFGR